MKTNRIKGFTLVELIIVMVILVGLASLTAYGCIKYVQDADRRECEAQLEWVNEAAKLEIKVNPAIVENIKLNPNNIFTYIEDGEKLRTESCPCGGKYTVAIKTDADGKYYFEGKCSFHTGEAKKTNYQNVVNDIYDTHKKQPYVPGSLLQKELLDYMEKETGDREYPSYNIEGQKFYLKVNKLGGQTAYDGDDTVQPIIYLSKSGASDWKASYFYYPPEDKWYYCGSNGKDIWLTQYNQVTEGIKNGDFPVVDIDVF